MSMFRRKAGAEISDQPEQSDVAADGGPRAPAVRVKLDGAKAVLAALEVEVAELTLEAVERKPGAAERLSAHRAKIAAARTAADELTAALQLAERLDIEDEDRRQAAGREAQFDVFRAAAEAWREKGSELAAAVAKAAKLRDELLTCTQGLQQALPSGIIPFALNFDLMDTTIGGAVFPASTDVLIAGEMHRNCVSGAYLPGARSPALSQIDNPASIEPLADVFSRMGAYYVSLLRQHLDGLKPARKDAA
ncbi:hypothetical protein ACNJX9_17815 [Bradyrhizobium sp. DASA03076]|uniref:hypothetical protein n=1 Tax=Bradyrhizobium sp. BLXBL-03 TaxID=3395916 RepID=UPI003F71410B